MSLWAVVTPRAATNLVTNPSIETATTGYTASGTGASVAQSSAQSRRGIYSLAVTPGSGVDNGCYYGTVSLTSGTLYYFSVDFKGVAGIPYKIWFANTSGTLKGTAYTFTATGAWQRVSVSWTSDSTTTYRLYMTKNNSASTGVFYLDGVQCEATYETTYVDGEQDGCLWSGTAHASTSSRDGQSRAGGRIIDFDSYSVTVLAEIGIGAPAGRHEISEQAFLPGAKFLGRRVLARTIDLVCQVKGTDYANLHALRAALWDALKPDLVSGDQEFWVRYTGANSAVPAWARVVYDSGLEGGNPDMYLDEFTLRLIAYDPMWYEEGEAAAHVTTSQSLSSTAYILEKRAATWAKLGTGLNALVRAMVFGPDGALYVGGGFTTAGGTTVNYVAKWDGSAWSALASGLAGAVYGLAFGPDGTLYAVGNQIILDGAVYYGVAKWTGSAWALLSATTNMPHGTIRTIAIGQSGEIYVGGEFTGNYAASVAYNRVAKWDGSAWSALGAGANVGVNNTVRAMVVGLDNTLYVGGDLTKCANTSVDAAYVCKYLGSWSALGAGLDNYCDALAVGLDGTLYAGGDFTTAGGTAALSVARWNGSAWSTLGAGLAGVVYALYVDPKSGAVYASGGDASAGYLKLWNGAEWANLDTNAPGNTLAFAISPAGTVVIGGDASATVVTGYLNTLTNDGSHAAYPIIYLKRSGGTQAWVKYVENEETGAVIYLDYYLLSGEELVIDLRPGRREARSSFFGKVWRAIERGSEIGNFGLLPGSNRMMVFVDPAGTPTITAALRWQVCHWMADGAA